MRISTLPVYHRAFRTIDTHEKAYLLGFLLADGCVVPPAPARYMHHYRVDLKIKAEDRRACEMLQEEAGGSLFFIEGGYRISWQITSNEIAHDLISLGVTPRKSLTAALSWDAIPEALHGSVLAGLIDGDGHLRFNRAARRAGISIVTGSPFLCDQLMERFPFFKVSTLFGGTRQKNPLYRIEVETNRVHLRSLIQLVYDPLPFKILHRKQAVLDQLRGYLTDLDTYDRQMEEVPRLKAEGLTIAQIAERLGTSRRPIQERLKQCGVDSRVEIFTEADREEMRRLHACGLTVLEIHASLGKATEQAVRFHLNRMGCITKTPQPAIRHAKTDEILDLHGGGMPAYRIAERFEMGKTLVRKILKREGVILQGGSPVKLTPVRLAFAEEELSKGRTLNSVALELEVSATLIRFRLKEKEARGRQEGASE